MSESPYHKIKIKKLAGSRVSIEGETTETFFSECYQEAIDRLRQNFEAPGFRKGHVPESVFLDRVNHGAILEEAADIALRKIYPLIVAEHNLQPIAHPQITVTKLAPNNPMAFSAEVIVQPEVKLPDYKKIAKKVFAGDVPVELNNEEVEAFIKQILDMETMVRNRDSAEAEKAAAPIELTDEFVKQLGPFENVADFKNKIREDMLAQKKSEAARDKREAFAKELIAQSSLEIPPVLIDEEAESSMNQILEDLKRANLTLEEYVKKLNKTEEEFRKEKREQIENQIKLRFLLQAISLADTIVPSEAEIEDEVSRLRKSHPEARIEQIRPYVELVLRNETVLKSLEKTAQEQKSE